MVTFGPPCVFERRGARAGKADYDAVSREMMAAIGRLMDETGVSAPESVDARSTVR